MSRFGMQGKGSVSFMGSGTTACVAKRFGRRFIGCELNETYIRDIAEPRIAKVVQEVGYDR
jgi:DNA modification methylase